MTKFDPPQLFFNPPKTNVNAPPLSIPHLQNSRPHLNFYNSITGVDCISHLTAGPRRLCRQFTGRNTICRQNWRSNLACFILKGNTAKQAANPDNLLWAFHFYLNSFFIGKKITFVFLGFHRALALKTGWRCKGSGKCRRSWLRCIL